MHILLKTGQDTRRNSQPTNPMNSNKLVIRHGMFQMSKQENSAYCLFEEEMKVRYVCTLRVNHYWGFPTSSLRTFPS